MNRFRHRNPPRSGPQEAPNTLDEVITDGVQNTGDNPWCVSETQKVLKTKSHVELTGWHGLTGITKIYPTCYEYLLQQKYQSINQLTKMPLGS